MKSMPAQMPSWKSATARRRSSSTALLGVTGTFSKARSKRPAPPRPACGDAERLDVVHEADAQDLAAVAVDGVDHVWRIA